MAYRFDISLQEKTLHDWIRERMRDGDIVPSLIFRDAMLQKKQEWDIMHGDCDPLKLRMEIEHLKKWIGNFNNFLKINGYESEFGKFLEEQKTPEVKK